VGLLKVLGWIFVPYVMMVVQWKKTGRVIKVFGGIWAVVALLILIGSFMPTPPPTAEEVAADLEQVAKSEQIKVDKEVKVAAVKADGEAKKQAKADANAKEEADKVAKAQAEKEAKLKSDAAEKAAEIEKAPHLGDSIGVGSLTVGVADKIQFTQKVGGEYLEQEAQGMYWVFSVGIKNGDNEARMIDTTMFKLVSDDGTTYDPDSSGSMYANDAGKFFLQNINPGIQVNGFIVFDMPPEAKDKVSTFKLSVDSGVGFAAGKSVDFILKKR
jgi:biopolymer transport protein ExbD